MLVLNALECGASGDGQTDDTLPLQKAIAQIAHAGGGKLVLPSGHTFLSGPLELTSHFELHLEKDARLQALPDPCHYPDFGLQLDKENGKKWLWARKVTALSITGPGEINGQGIHFMAQAGRYIFQAKTGRPFVLHLEGCRQIVLRDVAIRDAPFWTVHFVGCEQIEVTRVRIFNDLRFPNNDGINFNRCQNARVSHCEIEAGDDCICLKSTEAFAEYGACENIKVSHCRLTSTSSALKLGTESFGEFRHIVFTDCQILRSSRGVALSMRDGGLMENITVSNLKIETRFFHEDWWGAAEPLYVSAARRKPDTAPGRIRQVRFENIVCRSENGLYIGGLAGYPSSIEQIELRKIDLQVKRTTRYPGGYVDLRPIHTQSRRPLAAGVAASISDATNVRMIDCTLGGSVDAQRAPGFTKLLRASSG